MKTVKDVKSGEIKRVSNEIARSLVKDKTHEYISKSEWKKVGRPR